MNPTLLLALTQSSLNEFSKTIDEECLLVVDSSLDVPTGIKYKKLYQYPILDTAKDKVGKGFTANIVAVGLLNEILSLASEEIVKETVLRYIPKGTEEINFKALEEGFKLFKE